MSLIQPKARALISTRHSAELLDTEAHGICPRSLVSN